MRKVLLFFLIIIITGAILIAYYGSLRSNVVEEFYTIKENAGYVYDEDRYMRFNIYSNTNDSLISYPDKNNYSLVFDYAEFNLNDVTVEKLSDNGNTVYTISAKLDSFLIGSVADNLILKIKNNKYTLEINVGGFSCISSEEYPLLDFNILSPAYSYYDNMLYFSGINLELISSAKVINKVQIGKNAYGILDLCQNSFYEGTINVKEIIPNYHINYKTTKGYNLISNHVFIPFGYSNLELIRRHYILITIDGITYYIDSIPYYPSDLPFDMYDSFKEKGVITYA